LMSRSTQRRRMALSNPRLAKPFFGSLICLRLQPEGRSCGRHWNGNVSIYFGIAGGCDYRDVVPHFHEAHVDQDPEIFRAGRY
jgi:hypothetical protein